MFDRTINKKDLQVGRLIMINDIRNVGSNHQRCDGESIENRQRLFYKNIDLLTGHRYKSYLDKECKVSDIVIYNSYDFGLIAPKTSEKMHLSEAIEYAYDIAGIDKKYSKQQTLSEVISDFYNNVSQKMKTKIKIK